MNKGVKSIRDIKIFNVYAPNNTLSKYMRQKPIELQKEIDKSAIVVKDFNTPLSVIDRSILHSEILHLVEPKSMIHQLSQIDMYRLDIATADSNSHRTFIKINYILGDKTHLNKFKIEVR